MSPIERYRGAIPSVPVIEDAAQSIGARRSVDGEWTMAGEMAAIGTFSFFPSKNLGGYGDGGMIVTQDDHLAKRLRRLGKIAVVDSTDAYRITQNLPFSHRG